tara:strand:- start:1158 stop:1376 length:219 start_codon:yes stop_codon:yes gene_type:complete
LPVGKAIQLKTQGLVFDPVGTDESSVGSLLIREGASKYGHSQTPMMTPYWPFQALQSFDRPVAREYNLNYIH